MLLHLINVLMRWSLNASAVGILKSLSPLSARLALTGKTKDWAHLKVCCSPQVRKQSDPSRGFLISPKSFSFLLFFFVLLFGPYSSHHLMGIYIYIDLEKTRLLFPLECVVYKVVLILWLASYSSFNIPLSLSISIVIGFRTVHRTAHLSSFDFSHRQQLVLSWAYNVRSTTDKCHTSCHDKPHTSACIWKMGNGSIEENFIYKEGEINEGKWAKHSCLQGELVQSFFSSSKKHLTSNKITRIQGFVIVCLINLSETVYPILKKSLKNRY